MLKCSVESVTVLQLYFARVPWLVILMTKSLRRFLLKFMKEGNFIIDNVSFTRNPKVAK